MESISPRPRRRTEQLEVLYKISNLINTTLDREKVLRGVLKEVVRLTAATSGSIAMLDNQHGVLNIETAINIPVRTWKRLKLQLGVGVTGWAAFKGQPVRVNDVWRDPHYVAVKPDIRSELAVPMILRGQVIGVINVDSTRRGAFSEDDERLLLAVAEQSARVIETARLYEELRRYTDRMETLFDVSRQLAAPVSPTSVLELVTREGRHLLEADVCAMVEMLPESEDIVIRAHDGADATWDAAPPIHASDSLLTPVLHGGEPFFVEDIRDRGTFWNGHLANAGTYRSLMAVPVRYQDTLLGALVVLTHPARRFHDFEIQLLQHLANQCAVALDNARRQDRVRSMEDTLHRVERFSLLGGLAAEIAHEIRNPVTIINLLLEGIHEDLREANPALAADVTLVRDKVARIEHIVEQTLDMARNRDPRPFELARINSVIADVVLFAGHKLREAGIEVRTTLPPDLPPIPMDRGQLQQVFLNLILNAIDAMRDSSTRRLIVRAETEEDPELGACLVIALQDTGCGISREHVDSLFDPFYTTRKNGTGLGLFITRKLVSAHGGDVRVASRPGRGSTFSVLLPIRREDATPESTTPPPPEHAALEVT